MLVCLHGGGWVNGSGNSVIYDGARLAALGDVVVVSVNHRLAAFGYAHFADLGAPSDFDLAGVCGVTDMVLALEWVRDNIGRFGGDPERVLIFGQSGGGSKVSTLLASPSAKGLFHRAVVQSSWSALRQFSPQQGSANAELLLRELGIAREAISDIRAIPWERLLEAQARIGVDFRPVIGNSILPHHPFDPVAPHVSADVPLIVSTTLHDHSMLYDNFDLDEAGLVAALCERFGADAEEIHAAYRAEAPEETPFLIQARASTDLIRGLAMLQAERKWALGAAPAWLYVWEWAPEAFDGRYGAMHCSDVESSLHLWRSPLSGSGGLAGRLMCDRIAATLIAFAKSGDPANPLIPDWPPYEPVRRSTMVFDSEMRVVDDHRGDFVRRLRGPSPDVSAPEPA